MFKKKGLVVIIIALLAIGGYLFYTSQQTYIGLVNFRDAQMAEIVKANENSFIKPVQIDPKEDDFSSLVDYPVIYLSHISILTPEQKENLKIAMDKGSKVHVLMATSKENNFSNITGDELKYITDCFDNDGVSNIQRWLNYSRRVFHGKELFSEEITDPKIFPSDVFYRLGTTDYFEDIEEYWAYYTKNNWFKEGAPVAVVMSANNGPQSQFRSYLDDLILELESRNFNVVALAGYRKRLDNLKKSKPAVVISFPHGRMARGDASVDWLKENNILYFTPQLVYQTEEKWKKDQQGISGGIMGQNIVVPELDGAIHPYALAAEYITEEGFHTFKSIPGRVSRFGETVERWVSLKTKENKDKKLVIYYYKGPGKNALVAGGLEVGQSIYSLLKRLKTEGYDLGDMPDNFDGFMERIHKEGPLLGDYALGTFEKFLETGKPAMVRTEDYLSWCESELDPKSFEEIKKAYGEAPGTYMSGKDNKGSFLAIPRVQFGNIALTPVLSAALGDNEFKSAHGVKKAPPHAYVASYLWARKGFNADVVAHFGAHGSVEFTPWKQLLLSLQDWPEALIAPVPHLYVYSIDNIGEAMMAKRRSYATMISHLTPPYSDSQLYGELQDIADLLHKYGELQEGILKESYKKRIGVVIDSLDLAKDLEFTAEQVNALDDETVETIHHYLHEVEREKIIMGLHTLGVSQTQEEKEETVRMMAIDPIASALKQLAAFKPHKHHHHKHHHHGPIRSLADINPEDFEAQASFLIKEVLKKGKDPEVVFGKENTAKLVALFSAYGAPDKTPISSYYGGSYARKKDSIAESLKSLAPAEEEMVYNPKTHKMVPKSSLKEEKVTLEKAQGLAVHLSASRKTEKALTYLKTEEGFKELSGLLNDKSFTQFKTATVFNNEGAWKVKALENKSFKKLLKFVQDSTAKASIFNYLVADSTQNSITSYRKAMDSRYLKMALDQKRFDPFMSVYKASPDQLKNKYKKQTKTAVEAAKKVLDFVLDNSASVVAATSEEINAIALQKMLESKTAVQQLKDKQKSLTKILKQKIVKEKQELAALLQLKGSLWDIRNFKKGIEVSPKLELDAFVNGMNGGFIAPSSGGDPVSNPLAVPTGKNLYSINEQVTPTKEAYEAGQLMAEQILQKHIAKHGDYPKKIAYSLWGGEFIRNQGLNIGQIFYMVGAKPVRNSFGRVHDVELIPIEELKRPRIDVLVQTSGQFRDLAASRIYLINKAIQLATEAEDDGAYKNYVKEGTLQAEHDLKAKGFSPEEAQKFAKIRVFGGVNGNYGTGIMGLVEQGDQWETEEEIADTYIGNMGAMYSEDNWSDYKEGMFEAMLANTEVVVHPRSSNETGPISLDHVYEFMGGLTASIRVKTGKDPDGYFNDYRNRYNPKVQGLKEAIWTETRTNLFNPKYIKAQMQEGESAAEGFAENFRDTYGWNVMKPAAIDKEIWEGYYDIYVKDKDKLGTLDFFKEVNPYALQEMTAVMLETVRKGYWKPTEAVKKDIAKLHAELIEDNEAGCSGFVCDNGKLKEMIVSLLDDNLKTSYQEQIEKVRTAAGETKDTEEGMVLEKETLQQEDIVTVLKDNLTTILLLVILLGGAITWGVIKRRKERDS